MKTTGKTQETGLKDGEFHFNTWQPNQKNILCKDMNTPFPSEKIVFCLQKQTDCFHKLERQTGKKSPSKHVHDLKKKQSNQTGCHDDNFLSQTTPFLGTSLQGELPLLISRSDLHTAKSSTCINKQFSPWNFQDSVVSVGISKNIDSKSTQHPNYHPPPIWFL